MDNLRQTNQRGRITPQRPAASPQPVASQTSQAYRQPTGTGSSRKWTYIIGALVAVLAVVGLVWYLMMPGQVDRNNYQAVFLSNGQVYFGKLHGYGTGQPYMDDVYYFQAGGAGQTNEADAEKPEQNNDTQTLVKLGDEIHKPEDKLLLNPDAILFIENISAEGSVVKAIEENKDSE